MIEYWLSGRMRRVVASLVGRLFLVAGKVEEVRLMFANSTWFYPVVVPSELPVGLEHLDSNLCWCDPITELDDDGQEIVLHRRLIWN